MGENNSEYCSYSGDREIGEETANITVIELTEHETGSKNK